MKSRYILSIAIACGATLAAGADILPDWPEFRGPTGQGIAEGATPPLEWSRDKNIAWRQELPGTGWSSPSVYRGAIYVTAALVDGSEHPESLRVLCIDAATGAIRWNTEAAPGSPDAQKHPKNGYASPTPLIVDDRIYAHFGPLGTACLDTEGNVLWRQQGLAYQTPHGSGGSPVLYDGALIFSCDDVDKPFVVALDKDSGEVRWKTIRETQASKKFSFCTPLLVEDGGRPLVISPGSGVVSAYDPRDGAEVWRVRYGEGFSIVPRPVTDGTLVFLATGFARPSSVYAIRLGGQGDVTDTHVAWTSEEGTPNTPSMLVLDGALYFVSDRGAFSCADAATGKLRWEADLEGKFSASPVCAGDRIYATNEDGTTYVLQAGAAFQQLAQNALEERTFASPAFCGKTLFIRTERALYRIEAP